MYTFSEFKQLDEVLITFNKKVYPKFGNVVVLGGGAACFHPDTLVKTETGYKPIKDINTSDFVYSLNIETQEIELKPVVHLIERSTENTEDLIELTLDTGETIICTESHEFYVDGNWIQAKDL